jgi:hypothetical protein
VLNAEAQRTLRKRREARTLSVLLFFLCVFLGVLCASALKTKFHHRTEFVVNRETQRRRVKGSGHLTTMGWVRFGGGGGSVSIVTWPPWLLRKGMLKAISRIRVRDR